MEYICLSYFYSANPSSAHWYIQIIGGYVMAALAIWGIAYVLWVVFRKPLSLLMPMRERKVEIVKLTGTDVKALDGQNYMPAKAKVVIFYEKKGKRKKKTLYANHVGVQEGDKGILQFRGVFCTNFTKKGSFLEEQPVLYYHFGFNKNKVEKVEEKERRKRKYW